MKKLVVGLLAVGVGTAGVAQNLEIRVDEDSLQQKLDSASLVKSILDEGGATTQDVVAAARADYERLLTGLYSEGYYGPTISIQIDGREASTIAPLGGPTDISDVIMTVNAGPRFDFGRAEVAPVPQGTELPEEFRSGEVARVDAIRSAVSTGVDAWREEGYAKAEVESQRITARHQDEELDAVVVIGSGPQLTFGPLAVEGNEMVQTQKILRIAGMPTGEIYSPEKLDQVAERLRKTGAFSSVAMVESDTIGPNNTLPITMEVAEMPRYRVGAGAEVSSTDGLSLTAYWLNRNVFGGAESLRLDGEISGIAGDTGGVDYALNLLFKYPRPFAIDTTATVKLGLERKDEPTYFLDQLTGSITVDRQIGEYTYITGGLGFIAAKTDDDFGYREYVLATIPLTGEVDHRDNALNPKDGWYGNLELTPFIGIDNAGTGGRVYFDGRVYRSFGEDNRFTLAARGQVGSVLGVDADQAPADYLFYSGGGGTVRGQSYQSLGYEYSPGVYSGGLSLAVASLEARFDVTDSIGVVGFYDYGYVGGSEIPLQDGDDHAGAGLGLRYNTGIGPIRLDVATSASGENAGKNVDVYIGIGQAF